MIPQGLDQRGFQELFELINKKHSSFSLLRNALKDLPYTPSTLSKFCDMLKDSENSLIRECSLVRNEYNILIDKCKSDIKAPVCASIYESANKHESYCEDIAARYITLEKVCAIVGDLANNHHSDH